MLEQSRWVCRRYALENGQTTRLPDLAAGGELISGVRLFPAAGNTVLLALVAEGVLSQVRVYRCEGENSELVITSPDDIAARGPSLAVVSGREVVLYDAWDGYGYQVYLQQVVHPLRVSRGKGWHTIGDICVDAFGLTWVCWVRSTDVMNSVGVIDARCDIMVSGRRRGRRRAASLGE